MIKHKMLRTDGSNLKVYIMYLYTYTCMSNIGKAEKYRGILYILQCKKNRKTSMSMYNQIHYII